VREQDKTRGLYGKYIVSKADGSPVAPKAYYLVLRLDADEDARAAALMYAAHVRKWNPKLAEGIEKKVAEFGGT
jgi:hypothetical protein